MADEQLTGGNPHFELAVLGAALTNEEAWDTISRAVTVEDFLTSAHAQLFEEIIRADEEGRWGDADLIAQALVDGGTPEGYEVVADAAMAAAPLATLQHYTEDLRSRSKARKAAALSLVFSQNVSGFKGSTNDLAGLFAQHEEDLREVAEDVAEESWETAGALLAQVEQGDTRLLPSVPTGFPDLDRVLQGGFRPKQMVTIAGRPSMGKSTIVLDFARYASFHRDIPGLFLSVEMSREEIGARIASAEAAVPLTNIINDDLSDSERSKIAEASARLQEAPLYIIDANGLTSGELRAEVISAKRRLGIEYVVVDYLQLVTSDKKVQSRQEEVSSISRSLKQLAKQLSIVSIAVAQLNRGPEQRPDSVPKMSDLRESGALEQDSDIVGLVHRPDYYDKMSDRAGEGDLIIVKQRNGPTGTASFAFQGHYSRFMTLAFSSDTNGPDFYPQA